MSQLFSRTLQGDDPPFLTMGTDVSAKYKGAFCEAKIKKVVRNIKCKVTLKGGGSTTVNDDTIKGNLHVGNTVEVKTDPKKDAVEAVITKMQDCSQYTVVFDDGDITTLRRSALCLKSGRHFNESETLDQLPLTHPEHFSTPVIAGRRGRRGRALSEESEPETRRRAPEGEREPHAGRVVLVETSGGAERRRPHQAAFPALVVAPTAQDTVKIKVKEDYLVRSFKDGRYYTVPKKEAREFRKGAAPLSWGGVEAALQYLNNGDLPPHWDRDALFNEPCNASDDSSDDEPREEKDHFVAQLYKFMDDRGTPLNRNPTIANRDIDLYRLFSCVQKLGGYNRVTNQNQWKTIAAKMGFLPVTNTITNLCKQAYKKFLHDFEDFYRKLGVTLVAHPRGARTPPTGRSLIRDRDKLQVSTAVATAAPTPTTSRSKEEPDKTVKCEKKEIKETKEVKEVKAVAEVKAAVKSEVSDEDSADNQPLSAPPPAKVEKKEEEKPKEKEKAKEKEKEKEKEKPTEEKERGVKPRGPPTKRESLERRSSKPRRPPSNRSGDSSGGGVRSSRRPHASTDSDSSGRASRCGVMKKTPSRRSQSANSASSGNTIASSNSSKRARKRTVTERTSPTDSPRGGGAVCVGSGNITANVGDKLKVYYGPTQSESKVTYDAKVTEKTPEGMLRVHYLGWNIRYDEWIKPQRIAVNVSQKERTRPKKQDGSTGRRSRSSRIQQERTMHSDSDSDSDSERESKPPPKRLDDKPPSKAASPKATSATPPPRKISTSEDSAPAAGERSRKRTMRSTASPAPSTSTCTSTSVSVSPPKKPRTTNPLPSHQGRDYDLNEIRSEMKGLNVVKTEPEELKIEPVEKTPPPPDSVEEPKPEKPDEDVYEFKEPEPFEFELHDEKKKRTHRIFDDVSPKYSMKSIIDDINEEIRTRPTQRASLSPFRDYSAHDAGKQTPEDESRDDIFSLDGDSFAGDSSLGAIFEGFTPAKNQETYSKKTRVARVHKELEDSPESRDEDDQSTDEEQIEAINKEESNLPPLAIEPSNECIEIPNTMGSSDTQKSLIETKLELSIKDKTQISTKVSLPPVQAIKSEEPVKQKVESVQESPILKEDVRVEKLKPKVDKDKNKVEREKQKIEKEISKVEKEKPIEKEIAKLDAGPSKPLPKQAITENKPEDTKKIEEIKSSLAEPIRIALIEAEESKSEPDSPARMDELIPEPPPGFLLHSEGPKIAEKLLQAINSAKKGISKSPPPLEDNARTTKRDITKVKMDLFKSSKDTQKPQPEVSKVSVISPIGSVRSTAKADPPKSSAKVDSVKPIKAEVATRSVKVESIKDASKMDPSKKIDPLDMIEVFKIEIPQDKLIFDPKREKLEASLAPLQSALDVLERRRSGSELTLAATGKSNKVLSDTIQKLSTQITQGPAAIPLPTFPPEDRSDSSDSDDSDRRLIIDKLSEEDTVSGSSSSDAGRGLEVTSALLKDKTKSPVEWSAGESLLMLEDFCKAERQHAVARSHVTIPKATEEDSNISLLLCEETIPGSPAPEGIGGTASDTHTPMPARSRSMQMPFASAPSNSPEEGSTGKGGRRSGDRDSKGEREREQEAEWDRDLEERHPALDNTPPTTPDTSPDASPRRERRISEMDSMGIPAEDDDATAAGDKVHQPAKLFSGRSRKASESSAAGASAARRARRSQRDSDERPALPSSASLKYNFYVELDPTWDSNARINLLQTRLAELRRAYHSVKAELAAVDRRRKKLRRKEREAVKAAKAACL